jgi:hypothetical protein
MKPFPLLICLFFALTAQAAPRPSKSAVPDHITALRQEIKVALAAAHAGQTAFRIEAERYSSDLRGLGWTPKEAQIPYKLGFISRTDAKEKEGFEREDASQFSTDAFIGETANSKGIRYEYTASAQKQNLSAFKKFCKHGCVAGKDTFEILAVLPLGQDYGIDVWRIDHHKKLEMVQDGTLGK